MLLPVASAKTRGLMLPLRFFDRKQAGRADLQLPRALSRAKKTKLTRVLSESDVYLSSSSPASESRFVSRLPFKGVACRLPVGSFIIKAASSVSPSQKKSQSLRTCATIRVEPRRRNRLGLGSIDLHSIPLASTSRNLRRPPGL